MTCYAALASGCTGTDARKVYLDGVRDGVWACPECIAYAERAGLNPVSDRRAVARLPEWRKRSLAKDFTRQSGAA